MLAGEFRQRLPVIPRSTPANKLNTCIEASVLWNHDIAINNKNIKHTILDNIPGNVAEYKSIDTVTRTEDVVN